MNRLVYWESATIISFGISLTMINEVLQMIALIVTIIGGIITFLQWRKTLKK